ncbi:hypothetical protein [Paenirhodobacter sp.]|uniref:hypothetical protein n=1 Tax=Paenirhodobacter sp. TaxID=1965326 RepID=UPI003B3EAAE8
MKRNPERNQYRHPDFTFSQVIRFVIYKGDLYFRCVDISNKKNSYNSAGLDIHLIDADMKIKYTKMRLKDIFTKYTRFSSGELKVGTAGGGQGFSGIICSLSLKFIQENANLKCHVALRIDLLRQVHRARPFSPSIFWPQISPLYSFDYGWHIKRNMIIFECSA